MDSDSSGRDELRRNLIKRSVDVASSSQQRAEAVNRSVSVRRRADRCQKRIPRSIFATRERHRFINRRSGDAQRRRRLRPASEGPRKTSSAPDSWQRGHPEDCSHRRRLSHREGWSQNPAQRKCHSAARSGKLRRFIDLRSRALIETVVSA